MAIEIFLPLFFVVLMIAFAAVLIVDMFNDAKEDKARAEWRKTLAKLDEMKRKEREMFDMQAWEARKQRFAAMGIK